MGSRANVTRDLETGRHWRRFVLGIGSLLALSGLSIFAYNLQADSEQISQAALKRARAHFRDIILAWRWNAAYGGVYGEVRAGEGSNDYPEFPDLRAPDGRIYRLRHPDQMSRELSELARLDGDHGFRITSLKPRNPSNEPDPWERSALENLASGMPEYFGQISGDRGVQFRYMAPLRTEQACLQCHSEQRYQIGGLHGGISISFDISDQRQAHRVHQTAMGLVLLFILGLVLAGIQWFAHRLDRRLQRSQRRYRDLVDSTEGIVWEADAHDLRLGFISAQVQRRLGYRPEDCLGGDFWQRTLHPDDRPRVIAALKAPLADGEPRRLDYRVLTRDGREIWVQDAVSAVEGDGDGPVLRGVMVDISEHKRAERLAQNMLAEQTAIFQNALVGIALMRNGRIESCNRRFEEIFRARPGSLVGRPPRELHADGEAYAALDKRVRSCLERGERFRCEVLLRRRDGETIWGEIAGQLIATERPDRAELWIYADISARRAALDEASKFHRAVDQSPVSIVITDPAGAIEYVNPRFESVTGYRSDEVLGRTPRILQSGQTPAATYQDLWRTINSGRDWRGQLLNRRKDSGLFWEELSISPITDEAGAITHFVAIKEDISARKAAEQALEQHQAQLERLVAERTADLSRALEAVRSADLAKDEFLANVSHEIRTPLNAVIGLSGLAARRSDDPRIQDYLKKITSAGETLLHIINDLLDLSKIASGHQELEAIPFRLAEIIERIHALFAHRLEEQGLHCDIRIDPTLPPVLIGDPLRIGQILLNLVSNAVKFTAQGGITLGFARAAAAPGHVGVTMTVEDTGRGMSRQEMARLFEPFSQADTSIARTHGGSGLGLAICRRLAELMGGDVQVRSAPGIGSSFQVRLVLGEAGDRLPEAAEALDTPDLPLARLRRIRYRNARILVADDQPVNREIVRDLVAEVGIATDEAGDGQEALELITRHGPDRYGLVLLDVQMPTLDGYSVARAIRARAELASLPVIAMTAFAMEHERQACLAAGMNGHLAKPFESDQLHRLLAQWLPADRQYLLPEEPPIAAGLPDLPRVHGLDSRAGLARFSGRTDSYLHWLEHFRNEAEEPLAAVVRALAAGRRQQALGDLHAFKGRCGMLGMTALWGAIVDLEQALKDGKPLEGRLLATAREHHRQLLADLAPLLDSRHASRPHSAQPTTIESPS